MLDAQKLILKEVQKLLQRKHVDKRIYLKFLKRLKENKALLRFENPQDHFCVFFVPFDKKTESLYLGHHIKADDWIPPGGHIEENEHPLDTVKREMFEELSYRLTDEEIEFFDITIKPIKRLNTACKLHWDLWYLIYMDKTEFIFEKQEFYDARWMSLGEAKETTKLKDYNQTIQKIRNLPN